MKNSYRTLALCMITAAISLTHASCKKEEPIAPPPSPEQKAVMEVLKKSAEVAKTVFAAKVNGVEVTMHDLVREMNRIAPKYVKDGEKTPPATTAKIRKEALDNLIFNELAVQEAVRQGITVSPEKVNEVVKLMKEQLGSNDAYQKYLDDLGITEEGLKKRIERSHLLEIVTAKEVYQKITIEDKVAKRVKNVGKTVRFLVMNEQGKEAWIEAKIAKAVRVKSSVFDNGEYDHRYKVLLTFEWNGFRKEVLVTLNDRTNMEYPLLVGRNFLAGDFLVDVDKKDDK